MQRTSSTASSSDIINLVIFGSVTVMGLFLRICSTNKGITDPLEAMTFPYLVIEIFVDSDNLELEIAIFPSSLLKYP